MLKIKNKDYRILRIYSKSTTSQRRWPSQEKVWWLSQHYSHKENWGKTSDFLESRILFVSFFHFTHLIPFHFAPSSYWFANIREKMQSLLIFTLTKSSTVYLWLFLLRSWSCIHMTWQKKEFPNIFQKLSSDLHCILLNAVLYLTNIFHKH